MFQFEHIEYLLALLAVPIMIGFYYFIINWKKKAIKKIGDESLVKQLIKDYSPAKFRLKFILIAVAFSIGAIALANLRKPEGSVKENFSGIDVMIALDVSRSMLAEDIQPNRLERAKELIARLIDKLPDDRIGLVVFAGRAYLQMPLTTDHAAAKMYLSTASTDVVPTQGTVIGDALKMCYASFNTEEKKYKSIVLITDGEDHDENAIKITKALAAEGVTVNTVGIGSPEGATIPDPETHEDKKDAEGNIVITKLNEDELKNIAANGNGIYQLYNNSDDVIANLDAQLKTIGQRSFSENSLTNYQNFFQSFLIVVIVLLAIEFFLSENKKIKSASMIAKKATLFLILSFSLSVSFGQSENSLLQKGNEDYKNNKFDEAADSYQKAITQNDSNDKAYYNLGNALYKNGKSKDAINAYDNAIQNASIVNDKEAAFYNKGVVLQNNKKLPDCIAAYENALKLNPSDEDARQNLQKALQQQKQQQQQNQEKKQSKQDQKQQQQQNKNNNQQSQPQQPKMSKEDAEEKLKALMQQEKELQDKLRRTDVASPDKPEKDW